MIVGLEAVSLFVAAPSIDVTALEANGDIIQGGFDERSGFVTISAAHVVPLRGALFATGLGTLGLIG